MYYEDRYLFDVRLWKDARFGLGVEGKGCRLVYDKKAAPDTKAAGWELGRGGFRCWRALVETPVSQPDELSPAQRRMTTLSRSW